MTNAVNNHLDFVLDKLGRPARFIEPNQAVTQFAYDSMGRITNLVDGAGAVAVAAGYDSRGLLTSVTLPGGIRAQYSRDELGMLSGITDANGRLWQLGTDAAGRLISATDPLGNTEMYDYDNRHRPAHVVSAMGTTTLTYDRTGNLTWRQSSDRLDLRYTFDQRGLLTNATGITFAYDVTGEVTNCNGLGMARDAEGWISQITYAPGKTVTYHYDNRDRLVRVTDWLGGVTAFAYDQARRMTNITRPNGVSTAITYDANNQIASITEKAAVQLSAIALTRNNLGRITAATRNLPQSATPALSSSTFAYNQASRLSGASYDALGRLLSDTARTNAWDLASRLTSYVEGGATVSFGYDAGGLMTSRTQGGATLNYVWNYASMLPTLAVVRTNGADLRYYVCTSAGALIYSLEAGSNARRFYHFDEAGNTLFLTSDAGTVTDTYAYTPFGRLLGRTGNADNPFTFNGRWGVMQEGASGLYYMRARFYDAKVAGFLSPDAIRALDPLAVNPYQFGLNNPMRYSDATGLQPGDGGNSGMNPVGQAVANVFDPEAFQSEAGVFGLLNNANDALSAANTLRLMKLGR
ncbi:MAG: RHS repeat-associated core domain-containing protein [Verrucomicrobia bacterium]|nr:RHS repeat-associated core domain-containing protein [Verrucomicrobiota bacterium]